MLGELGGGFAIGRAKDLQEEGSGLEGGKTLTARKGRRARAHGEDQRDTAACGTRAIQFGGFAEPQLLVAGGVLPADDGGAVE